MLIPQDASLSKWSALRHRQQIIDRLAQPMYSSHQSIIAIGTLPKVDL
jgi:hypothetical protein